MRTFICNCGNTLYFDNTQCLQCGTALGFDPQLLELVPISQEDGENWYSLNDTGRRYHQCEHYKSANVCNWLVPAEEDEVFCQACRLNEVIPDLNKPENLQRWYRLEKAKRRMLYTLLTLKLPIPGHKEDAEHGLAFRFMEDLKEYDPYSQEIVTYEKIMTGHQSGTITINIMEADSSEREKIREDMNESYRTILGHFRHEVGHFYWDQLVARTDCLDEYRHLFGDEREDYKQSLKQYYSNGPTQNWPDNYISAYASAHPWEDWAETWAHYLHFIDILETATHHDVGLKGEAIEASAQNIRDWLEDNDFNKIIQKLAKLVRMLNELNRSLGVPDPYPFEHSANVIDKLEFIHRVVMGK